MFLKSTGMQIINTFKFYSACLNKLASPEGHLKCEHSTDVKARLVSRANEKVFMFV